MRWRPALMLVALVVLALAGLRQEGQPAPEPRAHPSAPAQSTLDAQPAPDADLPATLTAAVKGSAWVQTEPAAIDGPLRRPEPAITEAPRIARTIPNHTARPLTFPLLI